ncbi:iron complex transport system permease protein [Actinopolyspora alba]|uniref:Iron complex transport system permease protein n=1 Tax=Actinopolyspora alba TaxID=673379 RepID=A0A1I2AF09_9ACTN|nr:iron ABC transporter permease [Actinopolyspora alba]SFE41420.1 iron complex transport system permease protein [Actinopolyspora alba]
MRSSVDAFSEDTNQAVESNPAADSARPAPERVSPRERRVSYPVVLVLLGAALMVAVVVGLAVGSVSLPLTDVVAILGQQVFPGWIDPGWPATYDTILLDVRLPRVLLAGIVGAGLSAVGTALQALVRNPLADPFLLGISSGASLGAVTLLVTGATVLGTLATPMVAAFAGSMVTLAAVYALASSGGRMTTTRLVLAGVALSYVLSALTDLLLSTASDPHLMASIRFWRLGSVAGTEWRTLPIPAIVVLVGLAVLLWQSGSLNLLLAGEESAGTLGLDVHRFRTGMFVLVSLMTGVMVAVSGAIGFVGLMVPHAVRMLVGADHRRVLPTATLLGATFLILADLAARTVAAPQEIQLGVLTALCGGPFFVWLLRRQTRREKTDR